MPTNGLSEMDDQSGGGVPFFHQKQKHLAINKIQRGGHNMRCIEVHRTQSIVWTIEIPGTA